MIMRHTEMTSQEMMRHGNLPPGKWFWNVTPLGDVPDWQIGYEPYVEPEFRSQRTLFGYPEHVLLRKQYKDKA